MGKVLRVGVAIGVAITVMAGLAPAAHGFKPYTHAKTGDAVLIDVADGDVTIGGREYPVNASVVAALRDWPEFYRAGVIGPDGFPDLTYGQGVIHPTDTGLWMRHVFEAAWVAQTDLTYSAAERSQILAFGYGYLMHAAGDMWAHTLVNSFAKGTFPGVGEIISDVDLAAIALRHIIIEGYVGDATPGFDANPDRGPAPGGDTSDDSSDTVEFPTAAEFGGVNRFIFETLVDPSAATPSAERGPILGFFLDLRSDLAAQVDDWDPQPLAALTTAWSDAKSRFDNVDAEVKDVTDLVAAFNACDLLDFTCSRTIIAAQIVLEAADLGLTISVDAVLAVTDLLAGAVTAAEQAVELAVDALIDAYLVAWIADIDAGLRNWGELGRSITVALFDPQARRDLQNEECQFEGGEATLNRASCEAGIGALDVLFDQVDPFINDHLLSMLGAPDAVGAVRQALQDLSGEISALLGPLGIPFNPLEEVLAEIQAFASELIKDVVRDSFGIDVDALRSFLTDPTSWLNVGTITLDLPVLGTQEIVELFRPDDHERLDGYLGFDGTSHLQPWNQPFPGFPVEGSKLADSAVFDGFAAFDNVVTLGKLLLLDGDGMDSLLSDLLGRPYSLYGGIPGANVMLTPLPGVAGASPEMWLSSIDANHAWRADGQPVFAPGSTSGGEGNFPLWESCILRDAAFRGLFVDWENGDQQFPELGDATSADPNDPAAPTSGLLVGGTTATVGGRTFLGSGATLTVDASDGFWRPDELDVSVTTTDSAGTVTTAAYGDGDVLPLGELADGPLSVDLSASDPCGAEVSHRLDFVVDTTAPVVTITSPRPEGIRFDTDDRSTIGWTVDDGVDGSGVASQSVTLDGVTATNGQLLDMFLLAPGTHRIVVTATDVLGNGGDTTGTFVVRATAASLISNVDRALAEGLITKKGTASSLRAKLVSARKLHDQGKHVAEHGLLGAFADEVAAQRGKSIDRPTADRLIAFARDLIANRG